MSNKRHANSSSRMLFLLFSPCPPAPLLRDDASEFQWISRREGWAGSETWLIVVIAAIPGFHGRQYPADNCPFNKQAEKGEEWGKRQSDIQERGNSDKLQHSGRTMSRLIESAILKNASGSKISASDSHFNFSFMELSFQECENK